MAYVDPVELTRRDNRDRLRLEGRLVLRRWLNEAEDQLNREFDEALQRGEVLELDAGREAITKRLGAVVQRSLDVSSS